MRNLWNVWKTFDVERSKLIRDGLWQQTWAQSYRRLARLSADEGHCDPGQLWRVEDNTSLTKWAQLQRSLSQNRALTRRRRWMLFRLGFQFTAVRIHRWEENFQEVKRLAEEHEEAQQSLPTENRAPLFGYGFERAKIRKTGQYSKLFNWIIHMQQCYRKKHSPDEILFARSTLTDEQEVKLAALPGWQWELKHDSQFRGEIKRRDAFPP